MSTNSKARSISKNTQETIDALKASGTRFNIIEPIGFEVDLFLEGETELGKKFCRFVATLDSYGNIREWGPMFRDDEYRMGTRIFNASGEDVSNLAA